jgi:hypothetical protein
MTMQVLGDVQRDGGGGFEPWLFRVGKLVG